MLLCYQVVQQRSDEPELFDIENENVFIFEKPLPEIEAAFKKKQISIIQSSSKSFAEIVTDIVEGKSNFNKYIEYLIHASDDEYYIFFSSLHDKDVNAYITTLFTHFDDSRKKIADKVLKALKRLASESKINERRLREYLKYDLVETVDT